MTQLQWQQLEAALTSMSADEKQLLAAMLSDHQHDSVDVTPEHSTMLDSAAQSPTLNDVLFKARQQELCFRRQIAAAEQEIAKLRGVSAEPRTDKSSSLDDPIIGCMADESALLDEIVEAIYSAREVLPFRAPE